MMKKTLFFVALGTLSCLMVQAAPRTKAQMQAAAVQAIGQQRQARHMAPVTAPVKVLYGATQLEVIGYDEGGFAVVAADDLLPAVLGVSTARYSNGQNPNFMSWLKATEEASANIVKHRQPLRVTTPDPTKYPEEVLPLVSTKWYQTEPYSNMCPDFSSTEKCLTGCVATAMAQVLNYHQIPEHGIGERTIYYPYNNHNGQAVYANFEEDYYDWPHMLDIYTEGNYTQEEADAVALLMRDCGVAANMQYGGPNEGSGAYSNEAADGMRQYFGIEDAEFLDRSAYSEAKWMDLIYSELSENGPLYYGGADPWAGGHAFVLDGYSGDGLVSVNWGWAGEDDGYYLVSQLDPSGYSFSYGQDMIIGVKSDKRSLTRSEQVTLTEAGSLQQALESSEAEGVVASLTVSGPVNSADLSYIRFLAGWDADGQPTEGRLRMLDLTNALLPGNTLPDSVFKDCATLRRVRLPETLKAIGSQAFKGCRGLAELRVTTKAVPELLGSGVFENMPFGTSKLFVTSGLKTKYVQAAQWSDFGEKNIYQVGTSVKVRNEVRYYGEENPEFHYNVTGEKIEGEPVLSCEATRWSPAGRYPITIEPGTVENSEAVNFIEGFIIVRKVDGVEARVQDVVRYEGDENPQFQLSYSGLLSHDDAPVWLVEPTFNTVADATSPVGEYAVFATGGEAESYNVSFRSGKLVVISRPTAITDLEAAAEEQAPVYNLHGQRTDGSRKGIYVKNGKKILTF